MPRLRALPNPSFKPTRYGRQRKPGLRHLVHHLSPGLPMEPSRTRLILCALAFASVAGAPASSSASTTGYLCRFDVEASPRGLEKQSTPFELRFILDNAASKAYLMGNKGSAEVEIVRNVDGVSFIEITKSGNVMVTTVVNKTGAAVHSRNGILFNDLVPSQFYGGCSRTG